MIKFESGSHGVSSKYWLTQIILYNVDLNTPQRIKNYRRFIMFPHQFAEKVLELEINLEENHNIETIKALNELYGEGIDYYIDNQPKKARLLQRKMAALLSRPSVLEILEMDSLTQYHHQEAQGQKLHRKLKLQMGKFHTDADHEIKALIQRSDQRVKRAENLKNKDLNKQQQHLNERILQRVKSEKNIKKFMSCKNLRTEF